jgi:hypothetical protein
LRLDVERGARDGRTDFRMRLSSHLEMDVTWASVSWIRLEWMDESHMKLISGVSEPLFVVLSLKNVATATVPRSRTIQPTREISQIQLITPIEQYFVISISTRKACLSIVERLMFTQRRLTHLSVSREQGSQGEPAFHVKRRACRHMSSFKGPSLPSTGSEAFSYANAHACHPSKKMVESSYATRKKAAAA